MEIEEAKLYLEHTSKDDFNLEEWQKENRYQAIQMVLKEIEKLNYIIDKQDKDIVSLTKSKLILKKRYNKAIKFIKENESNISSIKDLENNKIYNSALLNVKDILKGDDK